ncbi:ABC transporter substrate-binding protein [Lampropedia puyangensis]|uniref:ABC transporter substrate-binding protein n=1 Tax=Lampropedia puyangensis TaxID=1330072 RepID=A0A4S8ETB4_9BURK|nr:ABC transporter substrate-binding protein [Lampropedia puyangensis]THT98097.1 ABC transporter substrate-binding protein [Lampropedia puyangensis]
MTLNYLYRLAAALALAAFSHAVVAQEPQRGGTLYVALHPEPTVLNVSYHAQYANSTVSSNVFESLFVYGDDQQPKPVLAESWELAPDGLSLTFHLRKDVKWHDGQPFTSEDVKYSALNIWKKLHSRGRVTFAPLLDVETPDAHTAIFRLERPALVILSALNAAESQIFPAHLYAGTDVRTNPYNSKPVGTGPFRFKKWEKGQYIELERNPDYWETGKPYLDRVIFRTIPDAAAREAALETGEVHVVPFSGIPFSDVERIKQNKSLRVTTNGYAYNAQIYYFEINTRKGPLAHLKVRQAFAHAFDKQALVDTVFYGLSQTADSIIPQDATRYYLKDGLPRYDFDPAKAERLLDEAGFPRKENGVRFSLTINLSPSSDRFPFAAELLRQNLKRVGVDLQPITSDVATYLRTVYTDYQFDSLFQPYATMLDPEMGLTRLFWTPAAQPGVPYSGASGYSDPATDRLVEQYQKEVDPDKRAGYFHDLQRNVLSQLPVIPLMEAPFFTVYNTRLHGLDERPDGSRSAYTNAWLAP